MPDQPLRATDVDTDINQRIRDYILQTLLPGEDPGILTNTTPLVSGGVIDSMNSLKVGLFLEKTFCIRITPEELTNPENLETIPAIARLVASKLSRDDVSRV